MIKIFIDFVISLYYFYKLSTCKHTKTSPPNTCSLSILFTVKVKFGDSPLSSKYGFSDMLTFTTVKFARKAN